jgi:hypothetical protein
VIITARKEDVEWLNTKDIYLINWEVILVYWNTRNNLLFINSSDNSGLYTELAEAILGENNAQLIRGIDVYKSFYNIKRTKLQNVGLKYLLGKYERFRMSVGSDVAEAMGIIERQKGEKAFVMGAGFEDGEPTTIGASYKGRIWSHSKGDIIGFKNWCDALGKKLVDPDIDPNQVLKETLIPEQRIVVPQVMPVWIDWDIDMYLSTEKRFKFNIDGFASDMSNTEICLETESIGGALQFSVRTESKRARFEIQLYENATDPENVYPDFRVLKTSPETVEVQNGTKIFLAEKFFEDFVPTVWFADGSSLRGNDYFKLNQNVGHYPKTEITTWDWAGVNLRNESQGVEPLVIDSIQHKVVEELKKLDLDIIYDDDYAGEIADVVTLKLLEDKIVVGLYHLKFALDGVVSNQIKNFYEVCGQAQKSVQWKHKDGSEFINHLLRRETKSWSGYSRSRLERGSVEQLERLLRIAKKEIPVEFEIYVVQPGASKATISNDILSLLGVTENYTKEVGGINLRVITSE